MTSQPVYSTALQQALSLLPHISPTEMKVLISAAKAQWAPRFSNEILADSFRFISRKTLTEKICPVNSRYFQICVNSVPNVYQIPRICVTSYNNEEIRLLISYAYCYDTMKNSYTAGHHSVTLDDFPHSAPFLRFDIVNICTHFSSPRICEFFRSHRESFSQCTLFKMMGSCFESKNVLAESDVQLCGLLADVFKNCKRVRIFSCDYEDNIPNKWIGNMISYITHYLFNTPNAFLKLDILQESFANLLVGKICEVFKGMTVESEFCVSFIDDEDRCSYLHKFSQEVVEGREPLPEEFRLWCRKIKPNDSKELSYPDGTCRLEDECQSLYTDYDPPL